jgi:hypothetical protein
MNNFFKKIKTFLDRLSSKPVIGGLQITDSALYCLFIEKELKIFSLRLPPGIIVEGKPENREALLNLFQELHGLILSEKPHVKIPIIVSLPASVVYSQVFNVPNVGEEKLAEAAELNLQMISPVPPDTAYASWEKIGELKDSYELLGAFTERAVVDAYQQLLEETGFSPMAFEFPGLSLSRLVGQFINSINYAVMIFQISSDGLSLFVLRNGRIYFDYFRSWRSIQGESREIPRQLFYEVVTQEVKRVLNFAQARFKENITQVFLIAPVFEIEMQTFLEQQFGFKAMPLRFRSWPVQPNWYVALGAALRGGIDRSKDTGISLTPISSIELFYEEQILSFIGRWRNILITILSFFVFVYALTGYLLARHSQVLQARIAIFRTEHQEKEVAAYEEKANEFNRLVRGIASVGENADDWYKILSELNRIAASFKINLESIQALSLSDTFTVVAQAPDYNSIASFKKSLAETNIFTKVDLVVPRIVNLENGAVLFTVTFVYNPVPAN